MRTRTVNKPLGEDSNTNAHRQQNERANEELQIFDSSTIRVEHTPRGIRLHVKNPSKGGSVQDCY